MDPGPDALCVQLAPDIWGPLISQSIPPPANPRLILPSGPGFNGTPFPERWREMLRGGGPCAQLSPKLYVLDNTRPNGTNVEDRPAVPRNGKA